MFPVRPLVGNGDTGEDNEDLLNARCGRWLGKIVRTLAKRTIRASRTVGVDVSKLCRGSKKEKDRKEHNEQNAGTRVKCPHFANPQHRYL